MYIEKMLAGAGVSALALVTYVAGKQAVADFLHVVTGYARHCLAVAAWGN